MRRAFTLVEFLIMMTMCALLAAMAIPAFSKLRHDRILKEQQEMLENQETQIRLHRGDHQMDVWLVRDYSIDKNRVRFIYNGRQWDLPLEHVDISRLVKIIENE